MKIVCFSENDVFQEQDEFPFSKMLTLYRKEPFVLNANYALPNQIPYPKVEIGMLLASFCSLETTS